jgi:hypothetical protein
MMRPETTSSHPQPQSDSKLLDNFLQQVPKISKDEWFSSEIEEEVVQDEENGKELYHKPVYPLRAEDTSTMMRQNAHQVPEVKQEQDDSTILDGAQATAHKNAPPRTPAQGEDRKSYEKT